jgi:hypothetical protein
MGALAGSLSYMRFLIDGEPPKNPGSTFEKAIAARRFVPLQPSQESPESAGWVAAEAPFDDELALTRDLFLFGDLVVLAYREDKWAIPRPVVKREVQKRIQKIIAEEKKSPDDIGKAFVKAVEQSIIAELKAKTLPRTKIVDVVWDMGRGEARVFGRGTVATERVASLFERTFQVKVDPGPWAARAFRLELGSRALGVLERLSPGWLFPDAKRSVDDDSDQQPPSPTAPSRDKAGSDDDDTPPWQH